MRTLNLSVGTDGIAVISIAVPDRPMNVLTPELRVELAEAIEQLLAQSAVRGIAITSGKPSAFIVGADINALLVAVDQGLTAQQGAELSRLFSAQLRRLETGGKPIACAINGVALGGGFELALACHYRVLADDASIGFPEVGIGLLPGAGGTQRVPRLIGIAQAERLLLTGKSVKAADALKLGLVHAVAPAGAVLEIARTWLRTSPKFTQPWDEKGFSVPGDAGPPAADAVRTFTAGTALTAEKTQLSYPAPMAILSCIYEGTQLAIDAGLRIESKYFGQLLAGPVARNMMRTLFVSRTAANNLAARPDGCPTNKVGRLAVLGAGTMGAGIAYVAARAGIDVVLLDRTLEQAERGKQHCATVEQRKMARGEIGQHQLNALLARIRTATDFAELSECDLVVEAVFESRNVKRDVISRAGGALSKSAVFASNTSTLPISELAAAFSRPADFIGLHFFSPVDKMPLVEVIIGRQTSRETLARALDFVGQIKKTPIVVNDSPGFYTSRVFGVYFQEGLLMLGEGVLPALIENSACAAGMPVGPLAMCDEVSMDLQLAVIEQNIADGQMQTPQLPAVLSTLRRMVLELKRPGRRGGAGFYDYLADGTKRLWSDLCVHYPAATKQPDAEDLEKRFLYIQALEAARCFEAQVVTRASDADLGSILGVGFPSWTGGTLSFIDMVGISAFVAECERFAALHGPRFAPSAYLKGKAIKAEPFYPPRTGIPSCAGSAL